jgi:hypothetical protein
MMTTKAGLKLQLAAIWCGVVSIVLYVVFWGILGHNVPPPSPSYNADEVVANYFGPYHTSILIGMVAAAVVGILYLPWSAAVSIIMRRPEHNVHLLSNIELLGGAITAWLLAECAAMWAHAAHYGTSNPVLTEMLWREGWFIFDLTYMITTVQMVGAGIYALTDKSRNRVFPRWTGWWAIAGGLSFVPLILVPFVTDGPFAWNGLWNFWVVWGAWITWFAIDTFYILRYLRGKLASANAAPMESSRGEAALT